MVYVVCEVWCGRDVMYGMSGGMCDVMCDVLCGVLYVVYGGVWCARCLVCDAHCVCGVYVICVM